MPRSRMLRSDLEAVGKDLREAERWIRAQIRRVQTKTMNMVLTAKPITVITRLIPDDIILSCSIWKQPCLASDLYLYSHAGASETLKDQNNKEKKAEVEDEDDVPRSLAAIAIPIPNFAFALALILLINL